MDYGKGTIVFHKGIRFKDSQKFDCRCGHPVMIPIASNSISSDTYYLLITSNEKQALRYPGAYYVIEDWDKLKLRKPSAINLRTIYKGNVCANKVAGLPPQVLKEVIIWFKKHQEKHPDEFYDEIKHLI